jgi:hypothetical protein
MTVEMEVKWEKRKEMQGTRVKKAVRAQDGRISGRGSYHITELGNNNCRYSVGKEDRGKGPYKSHKLVTATERAIYCL